MPTITAQSIVDKAQIVLQDTTAIRWPEDELLGWLNDGQREVAVLRPDSSTVTATLTLVAGTRQTLPAAATALVDIPRNTSGAAVRKVPREILDAQRPGWHTETQVSAIKHFCYDPRTPREFYVYPPAQSGAQVEGKYQAPPAAVGSIGGTITIDDVYANALLDYILFRAYSKDAEYAANDERAVKARSSFENTMGLKAQADAAAVPAHNTKG